MRNRSGQLETAHIVNGRLEFPSGEGIGKALLDGCFYCRIPNSLDLSPAKKFCKEFYLPSNLGSSCKYRGYRSKDGVYFAREHFQTEHVLVDREARKTHFPDELIHCCEGLNAISVLILNTVLAELKIPESHWELLTGGAATNKGTHWFAASHYRTNLDLLGCAPHKDTGFVTVLYMSDDGLEGAFDKNWESIDRLSGHFLINFGGALEILTRSSDRSVRAILHRVRRVLPSDQNEERFSFAAFTNPPASGLLRSFDSDGDIIEVETVKEYLERFNEETWKDEFGDFGIE